MDYSKLVPQRLDLFAFIIFLGVVQGFFFSYFLLKKPQRLNLKNRFLGLSLLTSSMVILEVFFCYTGWIVYALWLVDYSEFINFLAGPILFLLILAFIDKPIGKKYYLHFIPGLLYLLYLGFFFVQNSDFKFNAYIDAYFPDMPHIESSRVVDPDPLGIKSLINPLGVMYTLFYIVLSLKTILASEVRIFKSSSKELTWLRNYLILCILSFSYWLVKSFTGLRDVQDHLGAVLDTIIIYYVGFKILTDRFSTTHTNTEKYSKSSLDEDRRQNILLRLSQLMEEDQLFLENNLSLSDLAKDCGASNHHVSQVLNENLGKSYVEYINSFRVAYAKEELLAKQHLKIEEVAELCGYNSKSTFNTAFKKTTGLTPSEFRKSALANL